MKLKKCGVMLLIVLLIFVTATFAADGDFKIPSVVKDIIVNEDGSIVITEKIVYTIESSVKVY